MNTVSINLPLDISELKKLKAGDIALVSGIMYTARDAAHRRICEAISTCQPLPFSLKSAAIYYTGPSPKKEGEVIGVCGPTSSVRMDAFSPALIEEGVTVMIGKGRRDKNVLNAMRGRAIYLLATGGAAAFYRKFVIGAEVIAYADLDCEAVIKLTVKDMPLLVGIDSELNTILK